MIGEKSAEDSIIAANHAYTKIVANSRNFYLDCICHD